MKIHKAIQALFKKRGYPTEVRKGKNVGFFHGTGHGLGLEIHEYPRLQKVTLKAGQCLTVEPGRSEEHTSELQSLTNLVCRLLLEKKKKKKKKYHIHQNKQISYK